jgi:putative hydrolase of HD superfamily
MKMALVHDLAESIVGDITPHAPVSKEEKYRLEKDGFKHLVELLGETEQAKEMFELWEEYEESETKEALLVKDLDKFEVG